METNAKRPAPGWYVAMEDFGYGYAGPFHSAQLAGAHLDAYHARFPRPEGQGYKDTVVRAQDIPPHLAELVIAPDADRGLWDKWDKWDVDAARAAERDLSAGAE